MLSSIFHAGAFSIEAAVSVMGAALLLGRIFTPYYGVGIRCMT